jgi:hypothetical protein
MRGGMPSRRQFDMFIISSVLFYLALNAAKAAAHRHRFTPGDASTAAAVSATS